MTIPDERAAFEAWRVGRKVGRTIYNERDELIGLMDTRELAAEVVGAVNAGRAALRAELKDSSSEGGR